MSDGEAEGIVTNMKSCALCDKSFGKIRIRKKTCKVCSEFVCWECSQHRVVFGQLSKPVRVCNKCVDTVTGTDGYMTIPVSQVKINDVEVGSFMLAIDLGIYDPNKGPISLIMQSGRIVTVDYPRMGGSHWVKINNGQEEIKFVFNKFSEYSSSHSSLRISFKQIFPFLALIASMSVLYYSFIKELHKSIASVCACLVVTILWIYGVGDNQVKNNDGNKYYQQGGSYNCTMLIRTVETASGSSAVYDEEVLKNKMKNKWCFGALETVDIKNINLACVGKQFAGEWSEDQDRVPANHMEDVMQATGLPEYIHQDMISKPCNKGFQLDGTCMRVTTTLPGSSATVKKQQTTVFNLDGAIHSETHPTNKKSIIIVRHFIDGLDFVTQAVYCDTGNSQEIRRSVLDDGLTLLVHNTVTKKDTAEAISHDRYYSKIVI